MEVNFAADEQPVPGADQKPLPTPVIPAGPTNKAPAPPAIEVKAAVVTQEPPPGPRSPDMEPANTCTAVAAPASSVPMGDYIPGFDDIILPNLNIVQNIGQLKDQFNPGQLVLGQSVILFTPPRINPKTQAVEAVGTKPVVVTIVGFKPIRFAEKVIGGVRGLIVNTEAEVTAAGGTLDYNEWNLKKSAGMKMFQTMATALVCVERPEQCKNDGSTFCYEADGKQYSFGWWVMKGTTYTDAAKRVFFTARRAGCLKPGYPTFSFHVSTLEKTFQNTNKAWTPVCLPNEKNSPSFLQMVREFISPPEPEPGEACGQV